MTQIVLGSSSPFRKQLLSKIITNFATYAPNIDETPLADEEPEPLVERLALEKAEAVAERFPNSLIITSDQISLIDGEINGKPGTKENAIKQLRASSGNTVTFLTSLCLYNSSTEKYQLTVESYLVHFRKLTDQNIERYLEKEAPFNCAGSFKSEGLGIALFRKLEGNDPNTLIGLPLIKLVQMLDNEGVQIP